MLLLLLLPPTPSSVTTSPRSWYIKLLAKSRIGRMWRSVMYLSLIGEVAIWRWRRLIVEDRWWRRLRELQLITAALAPILLVLLRAPQPWTTTASLSHHRLLDHSGETSMFPFTQTVSAELNLEGDTSHLSPSPTG